MTGCQPTSSMPSSIMTEVFNPPVSRWRRPTPMVTLKPQGSAGHVQTAGVGRRTHFDTGAISTLITSYVASLVTVLVLGPIDIVRLILVAGLFALNVTSLTRVHIRLVSRPRSTDYALFTVNVAPYAYLLYPRPPAWLVIPAILLALFMVEVTRGRGRSALANVAGTALIASTYLPFYALMGGAISIAVLYIALTWVAYHAFSAVYVEGKLPFRSVKPWLSSALWFTVMTPLAALAVIRLSWYFAMPLIEPSIRAIHALGEGKIDRELRTRIRRIGFGSLAESLVLAATLLALVALYGH